MKDDEEFMSAVIATMSDEELGNFMEFLKDSDDIERNSEHE